MFFVGWSFICHLLKIMDIKYKLTKGSQVRKEDFGLLFYRMRGPRLYFISSGDLLWPDFFTGDITLEQWLNKKNEDSQARIRISEIEDILDQLCRNEVILEC